MVIVTIVATQFLDPESFGAFSLAAAAVLLGRTLLYSGAYEYFMKAPNSENSAGACLLVNLTAAVVTSLILAVIGYSTSVIFGGQRILTLMLLMLPSNLLASFTAWQEAAILRASKVSGYYLVVMAGEIAAGLATVGLLLLDWGIYALVVQLYARCAFQTLGFFIIKRSPAPNGITRTAFSKIVKWSLHSYGSVITNFISNYSADYIIGFMLSPAATGLYRAGSRITTAVSDLFTQPATVLSQASFSRHQRSGKDLEEIWPHVLMVFAIIALPALTALALVSGELSATVLGPTWADLADVMAVLCIARAAGVMSAVAGPLLVVRDEQQFLFQVRTMAMVVTVLVLPLVAPMGILHAAAVVATVAVGSTLAMLIRLRRYRSTSSPACRGAAIAVAVSTAAAGLAAEIASTSIPGHGITHLVLTVSAAACAWLFSTYLARSSIAKGLRGLA